MMASHNTIGVVLLTGLHGLAMPPDVQRAHLQALALADQLAEQEAIVARWVHEQLTLLGAGS